MKVLEQRDSTRDLKRLFLPAAYAGLFIVFAILPTFIKSNYWLHIIIIILIYIIAAVSLRSITITGQFPLAHGAFMGIGAYFSAVMAKEAGWSPWITIPLGGIVSTGIGVLIGYPFARLRALYYAMVSLFFGIGVLQIIFVFQKWTRGMSGLMGIPPLLPEVSSILPNYYLFLGLTTICLIALYRFEFCRIGIAMKAIAQSHQVASSVGINEAGYRVFSLAVGCFFVGIAGAAYAHYNATLSYTSFDLTATLWLFMYLIIGGLNSFSGPIIGTILLILIPELFRELKQFAPYISAVILLIVIFFMRQGLVSLPGIIRDRLATRRGNNRAAADIP